MVMRNMLVLVVIIILTATLLSAQNFSPVNRSTNNLPPKLKNVTQKSSSAVYDGMIKIYVVEPVSRYYDRNGTKYDYGFLDFALNETINLEDGAILENSVIYNAAAHGFSSITEDNIMAQTVIFNSEYHLGDAYPNNGVWFTAYYSDAAAEATPAIPGKNETAPGFTHTVFLEEATANYCPYCPTTRLELHNLKNNNDFPFVYTAFVGDKNTTAKARLDNEYNFYAYPTCFYDGGQYVYVGAYSGQTGYQSRLTACGQREVTPLDLVTRVEWLGNAQIQVFYRLGNNTTVNSAPTISTPTGNGQALPNVSYQITANASDTEADDVYYQFAYSSGDTTIWLGPYQTGVDIQINNTWTENGFEYITVRSKDVWGYESDWSEPLSIIVGCCEGIRGNVDSDGGVDISDLVFMVDYQFRNGAEPGCFEEADLNADLIIDVSDMVYLVDYQFRNGEAPLSCF